MEDPILKQKKAAFCFLLFSKALWANLLAPGDERKIRVYTQSTKS